MQGNQQLYQSSFDLFAPVETQFSDLPIEPGVEDNTGEAAEHDGIPRAEKVEGYSVYIFTKEIPERQATRQYYIVYQPSLWDHYTVQRQWGLVGSEKQQFYTEHFQSPRPALARIRRLIHLRLRRGYRLSYAA